MRRREDDAYDREMMKRKGNETKRRRDEEKTRRRQDEKHKNDYRHNSQKTPQISETWSRNGIESGPTTSTETGRVSTPLLNPFVTQSDPENIEPSLHIMGSMSHIKNRGFAATVFLSLLNRQGVQQAPDPENDNQTLYCLSKH